MVNLYLFHSENRVPRVGVGENNAIPNITQNFEVENFWAFFWARKNDSTLKKYPHLQNTAVVDMVMGLVASGGVGR